MSDFDKGYIKALQDLIALLRIDLQAARQSGTLESQPFISLTIGQAQKLIDDCERDAS